MAKALFHFCILAACFFITWFLLSSIRFTEIFRLEELSKENEHRIGTFIVDAFKRGTDEIESDSGRSLAARIKKQICQANAIAVSSITLHIIEKNEVNAFSLPDRHLIINTGLIEYCSNAEELAGIIAHEIAHMEHRHVMKKLIKEIGLTMLMTIAGGESTGEILRQTAQSLSSTAFDREQESDADSTSVRYMASAHIDPEHLANFLFRLSKEKNDMPKSFEWISTHPNSSDRAAEILKLRKDLSIAAQPLAGDSTWKAYQNTISKLTEH